MLGNWFSNQLKPGKTLVGRYKIIQPLGGGGFGQTFIAQDLQLPGNPQCVVKQLKPQSTQPDDLQIARRLFDEEAKTLHRLGKHDQIPQLLAYFEEDQEFYLVQELIQGDDLSKEIAPGRKWNEAPTLELLQDILKVLAFVHQQNVIHRDIKPANLIRRKSDQKIVLIDFGAVKQIRTQIVKAQGVTSLTVAIGTPGYMPSEQSIGKPRLCSDVYALGIMGIQALTGMMPHQLPEDPRTGEIIWRDKAQVSSQLADILDQMVRYHFPQRYQTADEALQAINQLLSTPPVPPSRPPQPGLPVFQFEVITVDSNGRKINSERRQAEFLAEKINGVSLEMVKIPGGTFLMGSPETEKGGASDERPQHPVKVEAFLMGKFPVTQAQWQAVAALPRMKIALKPDPSNFKGANRPVENVSWYEAVEFCARLSQKTGRNYRLPSEAEWEYACRAGTTTPFYLGETITTQLANYNGNYIYASAPKGVYRKQTTEVGSFPPNRFGLYDMHGNVWEWCADACHESYLGAPSDGRVWEGEDSDRRVLRGGSWLDSPVLCHSAYRIFNYAVVSRYDIGFRVVCAAAWTS